MYNLILQRAGEPLTRTDLEQAALMTHPARIEPGAHRAVLRDLRLHTAEMRAAVDAYCRAHHIDHAFVPAGLRLADFALLALDMDSTLINIETVDEIGAAVGRKDQIAAITLAAMRGEIADYADSLRRRVALLKGVTRQQLEAIYTDKLQLNPGAQALIDAAHAQGLKVLLATGGFTFFTDRLRERLGLDFVRANVLGMDGDRLDGTVVGPVVDGAAKREALLAACAELGCDPGQALAIGDGANDLPMMAAAGFSVAYHAKPAVRSAASAAVDFGGLDTVLGWFERD